MSHAEEDHSDLYYAVIDYDEDLVREIVQEELAKGVTAQILLDDHLIPAMDEIGVLFSAGKIFVPEMLLAANAMKSGLELLRPLLAKTNRKAVGRVVIGTVQGDLHDIGKNLVAMALEGAGFEVFDLGVDVKAEAFIAAVEQHQPDFVALSALLTTTMGSMKGIIERIKAHSPGIKVIVGGAPVTEGFADTISADGFGEDAPSAAIVARRLVTLDETAT